ncbi:hypothetical protein GCM10027187_39750 [Streptosporangium sandarakinum]|uniref:Uncharacterized protein n=1 Tax=Streptosporangium sandarakinum TaxID=1260955 RepID=A0A852VCB6_9ACTN|nr:hypothetical protein [Streptosporangium sandarakinum]NYF44694.1 hypothetical protein [Streptosporangium sandarakinum]
MSGKRRPLPDVEDEIVLERGVGPGAVVEKSDAPTAPTAPTAADTAGVEIVGRVVKSPVALDIPTAPQFELASPDASRDAQLVHYENLIGGAKEAVETGARALDRYWTLTAGRALVEIRDGKLYELYGYTSFMDYVAQRWGMVRQHAYKLMRTVRVQQALPEVTVDWTVRQVDLLGSVAEPHDSAGDEAAGDKAIREVWAKAEELGDTSAKGLDAARKAVGGEAPKALEAVKERKPVLPVYQRAVKPFQDFRRLRQVAIENPEYAVELIKTLEAALNELRAESPTP